MPIASTSNAREKKAISNNLNINYINLGLPFFSSFEVLFTSMLNVLQLHLQLLCVHHIARSNQAATKRFGLRWTWRVCSSNLAWWDTSPSGDFLGLSVSYPIEINMVYKMGLDPRNKERLLSG